ncbi:hypothetical protein BJX65DRAFT_286028 [Aspergillus insuetus]
MSLILSIEFACVVKMRRRLLRRNEQCCGRVMDVIVCRHNGNGNKHRQYRKCQTCGWCVADDYQGWHRRNPLCHCECRFPSRLQHERSRDHWTYRCLLEKCGFKERAAPRRAFRRY